MVFNYIKAKQALDTAYFVNIYRVVSGVSDGTRLSSALVYSKEGGTGPNAGKAFYTPPKGPGIVEAKMASLIDFLNDDKTFPIDTQLNKVRFPVSGRHKQSKEVIL